MLLFAFDPGRLAFESPQVGELGSSHLSPAEHIDMFEPGRMGRKDPLNPDAVRNLPDGEGG